MAKTFGGVVVNIKDLSVVAEVCTNFATKIEAHLYGYTDESISPDYGRRFRELSQGLKHA